MTFSYLYITKKVKLRIKGELANISIVKIVVRTNFYYTVLVPQTTFVYIIFFDQFLTNYLLGQTMKLQLVLLNMQYKISHNIGLDE
jgi:hypothetical protein